MDLHFLINLFHASIWRIFQKVVVKETARVKSLHQLGDLLRLGKVLSGGVWKGVGEIAEGKNNYFSNFVTGF